MRGGEKRRAICICKKSNPQFPFLSTHLHRNPFLCIHSSSISLTSTLFAFLSRSLPPPNLLLSHFSLQRISCSEYVAYFFLSFFSFLFADFHLREDFILFYILSFFFHLSCSVPSVYPPFFAFYLLYVRTCMYVIRFSSLCSLFPLLTTWNWSTHTENYVSLSSSNFTMYRLYVSSQFAYRDRLDTRGMVALS